MLFTLRRFFIRLLPPRISSEIHYVNGSDTLPPPLAAEVEAQMLGNIEDSASRDVLIEHNLRLVVYIAKQIGRASCRERVWLRV